MEPRPLEVRCGYSALGQGVQAGLAHLCLPIPLTLLLDAPFGFALYELTVLKRERTVIVSDNPCPEYWDDLWREKPLALIVQGTRLPDIQKGLEQAARGEGFKRTPQAESPLSESERSVLRLCALGKKNADIAKMLHLSSRTVSNTVSRIQILLRLNNRTELPLYYFGLWSQLESYRDKVDKYNSSD